MKMETLRRTLEAEGWVPNLDELDKHLRDFLTVDLKYTESEALTPPWLKPSRLRCGKVLLSKKTPAR